METEFFKKQMKNLTDQFNERNYSRHKIDLIWSESKQLSNRHFQKVVDYLIGEKRYAPTLSDFREARAIFREEAIKEMKKSKGTKRGASISTKRLEQELKSIRKLLEAGR